jgi:hypothetical protein
MGEKGAAVPTFLPASHHATFGPSRGTSASQGGLTQHGAGRRQDGGVLQRRRDRAFDLTVRADVCFPTVLNIRPGRSAREARVQQDRPRRRIVRQTERDGAVEEWLVRVDSETIRPPQTTSIRSSLVTTRSRFCTR